MQKMCKFFFPAVHQNSANCPRYTSRTSPRTSPRIRSVRLPTLNRLNFFCVRYLLIETSESFSSAALSRTVKNSSVKGAALAREFSGHAGSVIEASTYSDIRPMHEPLQLRALNKSA
jgi:hypothetical protein